MERSPAPQGIKRLSGRLAAQWWGAAPRESTPERRLRPVVPLFPNLTRWKPPDSELRYDLGPDRDHPDEQRDGRQCSRLFHENPEHGLAPLLERMKNIVLISFLGVKRSQPPRNGMVNSLNFNNKKPRREAGAFDDRSLQSDRSQYFAQ